MTAAPRLWTVVSQLNEEARWRSFGERLRERGVENVFEPWTGPTLELTDLDVFSKYHFVRVGTSLGSLFARHLKVQSTWVNVLGVIDGMTFDQGTLWPRCSLYDAFGEIFISLGHKIDPRGSAIIAGAGGVARTAVSALFRAGFKTFHLTGPNEVAVRETVDEIRKRHFGLNVDFLPPTRLVTLPSDSSVLVNCVLDSAEGASLLAELSYLNFLKRSGFVIDLTRSKEPSVLVTEAQDAMVDLLTYADVAARCDVLWARWAFGVELDQSDRRADLERALS